MASRSPLVSPTPLQYGSWVIPAGVSVPIQRWEVAKLTQSIFHIDPSRDDNDERATQSYHLSVTTHLRPFSLARAQSQLSRKSKLRLLRQREPDVPRHEVRVP